MIIADVPVLPSPAVLRAKSTDKGNLEPLNPEPVNAYKKTNFCHILSQNGVVIMSRPIFVLGSNFRYRFVLNPNWGA